jgi:hypothetical protein
MRVFMVCLMFFPRPFIPNTFANPQITQKSRRKA